MTSDIKKFPVLLHVLTGDVLRHCDINDGSPFIVDLETILFNDDAKLDYDHESQQIECVIGNCKNFRVTDEGLFADGLIIQTDEERDPVGLLLAKIRSKEIKYGCSPRIVLGLYVDLPEGNNAVVNGIERSGPLRIYKNSTVQGVAVSPYPTDEGTSVKLLSASDVVLLASNNSILKEIKNMADDSTIQDAPETPSLKEPLLQELADLVGAEKALELYQSDEDLQTLLDGAAVAAKLGLTATKADASLSDETEMEEDDEEKEKAAQL